jgi:hypothetical protein
VIVETCGSKLENVSWLIINNNGNMGMINVLIFIPITFNIYMTNNVVWVQVGPIQSEA